MWTTLKTQLDSMNANAGPYILRAQLFWEKHSISPISAFFAKLMNIRPFYHLQASRSRILTSSPISCHTGPYRQGLTQQLKLSRTQSIVDRWCISRRAKTRSIGSPKYEDLKLRKKESRRRAEGSEIRGARLSEWSCGIRPRVPEGKACRSRNTKCMQLNIKHK